MDLNMCDGQCGSEGFFDQASGVLLCDDCGKPDVRQAMTRLHKALKRGDRAEIAAIYSVLASRTWEAALGERRVVGP